MLRLCHAVSSAAAHLIQDGNSLQGKNPKDEHSVKKVTAEGYGTRAQYKITASMEHGVQNSPLSAVFPLCPTLMNVLIFQRTGTCISLPLNEISCAKPVTHSVRQRIACAL